MLLFQAEVLLTFITYCCKDVAVSQVDILGHRGNCDSFAICNTENAHITDCFARTADDEFVVKVLGGTMRSKNITFSNCVAWGGYALCLAFAVKLVTRFLILLSVTVQLFTVTESGIMTE